MGQQHGVDGFGKHHAGRGAVAELPVLFGADGLVEGGGAGEIGDRQVDEDHFGHGMAPFGVSRPKDERPGADPTPGFRFFEGACQEPVAESRGGDMLGENPHHSALHGPGFVEQPGRNLLDGVAMLEKLPLSRRARRASHARKLIHRGIADLAVDRLAVVQHGKSERQAFVVVAHNATTCQRHQELLPSVAPDHSGTRRKASNAPIRRNEVRHFVSAGSRCTGSIHSTVSGFSTGSMSRLIAIASPSLRTSTHSSTSSGLALIS